MAKAEHEHIPNYKVADGPLRILVAFPPSVGDLSLPGCTPLKICTFFGPPKKPMESHEGFCKPWKYMEFITCNSLKMKIVGFHGMRPAGI